MSYAKSWTTSEEIPGGCPYFAFRSAVLGVSILFGLLGLLLLALTILEDQDPSRKTVTRAMNVPTYPIAIGCLCATLIFPICELVYFCKLKASRR